MAHIIRNNNEMLVKLSSASLLMLAAKEKLYNYMKTHQEVYNKISEDEEAMLYFNLYYEENENELIDAAEQSLYTSSEAENAIEKWKKDNESEG
ncbi:hypothetical protein [Virgibacillus salexigens]|uniref:hypothetical protein n=1 Tax=Virgibacillus salexigens TaxID=61016 RepID=UPI003081D833